MFYWRDTVPAPRAADAGPDARHYAEVCFTNRSARRGQRPYHGLNLARSVGDDIDDVLANRAVLAAALRVDTERLVFMHCVHGNDVVEVDGPWTGTHLPKVDGIVSRTTDLALVVLVADCVPVLLHDVGAGVVGVVHAGRPGLLNGVVLRAVDRMHGVGASDVSAVVGPSVCGPCYEVPADMAEQAAHVAPTSLARSWADTPAVDIAAGVVEQLGSVGVSVQRVDGCTREDPNLYSYRRDRVTGRFAGVIILRQTDDAVTA